MAHAIAEVPLKGGLIQGMEIPAGYARVHVDSIEKGWEDLDLDIPGRCAEMEVGQAIHLNLLGQAIHKISASHDIIDTKLEATISSNCKVPCMDPPSPLATSEPKMRPLVAPHVHKVGGWHESKKQALCHATS